MFWQVHMGTYYMQSKVLHNVGEAKGTLCSKIYNPWKKMDVLETLKWQKAAGSEELIWPQPQGMWQIFVRSHWTAIMKEGSQTVSGCNEDLRDEYSVEMATLLTPSLA
jgi:hypothetical protein